MKRLFTSLLITLTTLTMMAQGWPEKYEGVMLQGFYWDSYTDSKWTNLESQADELSQYFKLIWVPQSGYCNTLSMQMGYSDIWWLDHKSCFGTEAELRSMINTYKAKGVGIIEDVVINHKNGNTSWCDFPNESKNGYTLTWDNVNFSGICKTDECNTPENLEKWAKGAYAGKKATGNDDTGSNFDGCRDLDHTNAQVRQNIKTYLQFLRNYLGYTGFRYDMVGGYDPKYIGEYNTTENVTPDFSVGEYWMDDGNTGLINWINGTKVDGKIQSAAFDFTTKWNINTAFSVGKWSQLKESALANNSTYARYAVTFVDNHDTYRDNNKLSYNICAANAYILTMPGTPCVFLPHWQDFKGSIKRMIATRKAVGINNESQILEASAETYGFVLKVKGSNGTALLILGKSQNANTTGFKLIVEGRKYQLYVSDDVNTSSIESITDTDAKSEDVTTVPNFCTVNTGETCAFFEVPASWNMTSSQTVKCWRWDKQYNYTTNSWPGSVCVKVGNADNGNAVWKWTFKSSERKSQSSSNEGIIFNDGKSSGAKQTADMPFDNGGYYLIDGLWDNVANPITGIEAVRTSPSTRNAAIYDLQGRKVNKEQLKKGLYIVNGKKVVIK